ncbi:hypothetical protein ABP2_1831 [Bacillus subtilis subsp. subtilis]|nr:hypothetical protein [Bacillus subtilis subsp. subtilis]
MSNLSFLGKSPIILKIIEYTLTNSLLYFIKIFDFILFSLNIKELNTYLSKQEKKKQLNDSSLF